MNKTNKPTFSRIDGIMALAFGFFLLIAIWHCNTYYAAIMGAILP